MASGSHIRLDNRGGKFSSSDVVSALEEQKRSANSASSTCCKLLDMAMGQGMDF